jgi:Domain of unknown function (DUF4291)
MMYRCGWATKAGQERVLAIEITRAGFEWALAHACLSHFDPAHHRDRGAWSQHLKASPVRVQWDPERSLRLAALPYRSLQVGYPVRPSTVTSTSGPSPSLTRPRPHERSETCSAPATNLPQPRCCPPNGHTRCQPGSPIKHGPAARPVPGARQRVRAPDRNLVDQRNSILKPGVQLVLNCSVRWRVSTVDVPLRTMKVRTTHRVNG